MAWLEPFARDLLYSIRASLRAPVSSIATVLTFVVGLGLSCAIFTLINGLFFRAPVSYDPDSFVQVYAQASGARRPDRMGTPFAVTLEYFTAAQRESRTLSALTVSRWASFKVDTVEGPDLRGQFVSCNYLTAHPRRILLGRGFVEGDCSFEQSPVALLTERGWSTRFGSRPSVVGSVVRLNGHDVFIVGVATDALVGDPVAPLIFVPYTLQPLLEPSQNLFRSAPGRMAWLNLTGRLAAGRTRQQAEAELQAIATAIDRLHPESVTTVKVTNGAAVGQPSAARHLPVVLALSFGGTTLVLVLVCANVATLLLARSAARRRELAVRLSLGASRQRVISQLLTEGAALAFPAGLMSLALAFYLPGWIAQSLTQFPLAAAFDPDWRVLFFTLGTAVLAGCLAAVGPALEALRFEVCGALRDSASGTWTHKTAVLCGRLLSAQLAVCFALMVMTGLMLRSQARLLTPTLGYDPDTMLVTSLDLARSGYSPFRARTLTDQLRHRLASLPGVEGVAFSSPAPFQGELRSLIRSRGVDSLSTPVRFVSAEYFQLTGVPLRGGRLFENIEPQERRGVMEVVASESLARRISPDRDAVGRRIEVGESTTAEIVGVVADTTSMRPGEPDEPLLYVPLSASNVTSTSALVRFTGDAYPLVEAIRQNVRALESQLAVTPETIQSTLVRAGDRYAALSALAAVPSGLALFLSIIGIAGLTAFGVAQRRCEIAIRVALGARPHQIVSRLARGLASSMIVGVAGGVSLSLFGGVLIDQAGLLVTGRVLDPVAYGAAFGLLASAAAGGTLIPLIGAARHDTWTALKSD